MNIKIIGQLAGAALLGLAVTGCVDVTMDIEVLSETNGRATTTMSMAADFYAMAKAGAAQDDSGDGFCDEEGAVLTENDDGSATCTMVSEGTFEDLRTGDGDDSVKFEVVGPGLVRASLATADMSSEVTGGEEQDEQTKAMMEALFEGHTVTIRISGTEIVDTNMTLAADRQSAEIALPFLDLMQGTADLPDEIFATVRTR